MFGVASTTETLTEINLLEAVLPRRSTASRNTRFQGSIKIVNRPIEHGKDPMKLHSKERL